MIRDLYRYTIAEPGVHTRTSYTRGRALCGIHTRARYGTVHTRACWGHCLAVPVRFTWRALVVPVGFTWRANVGIPVAEYAGADFHMPLARSLVERAPTIRTRDLLKFTHD